MYEKAGELGGQVSGEHGTGHVKVGFLTESLGRRNMNIMQGIKSTFDPNYILNQ